MYILKSSLQLHHESNILLPILWQDSEALKLPVPPVQGGDQAAPASHRAIGTLLLPHTEVRVLLHDEACHAHIADGPVVPIPSSQDVHLILQVLVYHLQPVEVLEQLLFLVFGVLQHTKILSLLLQDSWKSLVRFISIWVPLINFINVSWIKNIKIVQ